MLPLGERQAFPLSAAERPSSAGLVTGVRQVSKVIAVMNADIMKNNSTPM
jgi:hypothetical protein